MALVLTRLEDVRDALRIQNAAQQRGVALVISVIDPDHLQNPGDGSSSRGCGVYLIDHHRDSLSYHVLPGCEAALRRDAMAAFSPV